MADRTKPQSLLEPVDEHSGAQLPPLFAEAITELRAAISRCDATGIPKITVVSALMSEAMPRLVDVYGHSGASLALAELARELSSTGEPPAMLQ